MMKRSADCVCRCAGATSPGMMSCRPANSEGVIAGLAAHAGVFQYQHAPISASFAVIIPPAWSRVRPHYIAS